MYWVLEISDLPALNIGLCDIIESKKSYVKTYTYSYLISLEYINTVLLNTVYNVIN